MGRGTAGPGAAISGGAVRVATSSGRTVDRGAHASARPSVQTRGKLQESLRRAGFTSARECSLQSRFSAEYSAAPPPWPERRTTSVSYTHLTLPTSDLV